jgi:hypothetical protein
MIIFVYLYSRKYLKDVANFNLRSFLEYALLILSSLIKMISKNIHLYDMENQMKQRECQNIRINLVKSILLILNKTLF